MLEYKCDNVVRDTTVVSCQTNKQIRSVVEPTVYDISIIKEILKREDMQMLVDSEDINTENYFKPIVLDTDNKSYDSNDTRYMLNKRKIDLMRFLLEIGAKLDYVSSGATGHTFRGDVIKDTDVIYQFAMKVAAYPKRKNYGNITNLSRPENAEIMMLRTLSYFVVNKQTPHLILPIVTFYTDIKFFLLLSKFGYIKRNLQKYDDFIKKYKEGKYENTVSILLSEWANKGDFLNYAKKNYKNFKLIHWKVFFFQILSVVAIIQSKYPSFRHNDMKANNILVHKLKKQYIPWLYRVCNKSYIVPNIGYQLKLWDFDFACIKGVVENVKVNEEWTNEINITPEKNRYYDIHYFFNTLIKFIPEIFDDRKHVHQDVQSFIKRVVPEIYRDGDKVNKKGRILVNDEYTTPQILLETDDFFTEFRRN